MAFVFGTEEAFNLSRPQLRGTCYVLRDLAKDGDRANFRANLRPVLNQNLRAFMNSAVMQKDVPLTTVEALGQYPHFRQGIKTYNFPVLCAYFLSENILPLYFDVGFIRQYRLFEGIFAAIKEHAEKRDFKSLADALAVHLRTNYAALRQKHNLPEISEEHLQAWMNTLSEMAKVYETERNGNGQESSNVGETLKSIDEQKLDHESRFQGMFNLISAYADAVELPEEERFNSDRPKYRELCYVLRDLAKDDVTKWRTLSTFETWVNRAHYIKQNEVFIQGMQEFGFSEVCAYFLSEQLLPFFAKEVNIGQHQLFVELLSVVKKSEIENQVLGADFKRLAETFIEFLDRKKLPFKIPVELIQRWVSSISEMARVYVYVKFEVSNNFSDKSECDNAQDEQMRFRLAALMLEHIGLHFLEKDKCSSLDSLQNALVEMNLLFMLNQHPRFQLMAKHSDIRYSFFELLNNKISPQNLVTWYIVEQLMRLVSPVSTNKTTGSKKPKVTFGALFRQCVEWFKKNQVTDSNLLELAKQFIKLQEKELNLKELNLSSERDIFRIERNCELMLKAHFSFANMMKQALFEGFEPMRLPKRLPSKHMVVIAGDSVSAGVEAQNSWPLLLERDLIEQHQAQGDSRLIPFGMANHSVPHYTTDQMLTRVLNSQFTKFELLLLIFKPKCVIWVLGGNDFLNGVDVFTILKNLKLAVIGLEKIWDPCFHRYWYTGILSWL